MFDPWRQCRSAHLDELIRPPCREAFEPTGRVRSAVLAAIDRRLQIHLAESILGRGDPIRSATPQFDRWVTTSAMQKAIRRGLSDGAEAHATASLQFDEAHVFRRLAICALEDVGLGDFLTLASTLSVTTATARKQFNPLRLACHLAMTLAESPKSRAACDLRSPIEYASNGPRNARHQKDFLRIDPVGLSDQLRQRRAPLLLHYVADRCATRLRDTMCLSLPAIWDELARHPQLSLIEDRRPALMIDSNLPLAALDIHTRIGRAAIAELIRDDAALRQLAKGQPDADAALAVGFALFIIEGAQLDRGVAGGALARWTLEAQTAELCFAGIPADAQCHLTSRLTELLPRLNDLRLKLLSRSMQLTASQPRW